MEVMKENVNKIALIRKTFSKVWRICCNDEIKIRKSY